MPRKASSNEWVTVDIVPVLIYYGADARHIPTRVGWRGMKCPFHEDSHASARVNIELGAFRCLACGMSGDGLKLIRRKEGMKYAESIEYARQVFGKSVNNVHSSDASREKPVKFGRNRWKKILD
jgi:DNA primase